jgi:hypothetical protein
MRPKTKERLKILLLNENGIWMALCLNYDLAAQAPPGEKWEGALQAFNWTYWTQFQTDKDKGVKPFSTLSKAPEQYWRSFDDAVPVATRFELKPPFPLSDKRSVSKPPEEVRVVAAAA